MDSIVMEREVYLFFLRHVFCNGEAFRGFWQCTPYSTADHSGQPYVALLLGRLVDLD